MIAVTIQAHGALSKVLGLPEGPTTVVSVGDITVDRALKTVGVDAQRLEVQGTFLIVYEGRILSATGQIQTTVITSDGLIELLPAIAGGEGCLPQVGA